MADLMSVDKDSGRLVRKTSMTRSGPDKDQDVTKDAGGGGGGGSGRGPEGGGGVEIPSPFKASKRKPRSPARRSGDAAADASAAEATEVVAAAAEVSAPERFEVFVAKEDFKFSSSHFVAFEGFRERLHGHNYSCSVRLRGEVCEDGYVIDFGIVKRVMRKLCKELNERFLCPMKSDALEITLTGSQVVIVCEDGATFVLPRDDCALLPLVHSTAEELAHFLFCRLLREFSLEYLHSRGVTDMDVSVAELPRQEATYRGKIPHSEDLIEDPPYRKARRVRGCFGCNNDDDGCSISYSGGAGKMNLAGGLNHLDMGINVLSPSTGGGGGGSLGLGGSALGVGAGWNVAATGLSSGGTVMLGNAPGSGVMMGRSYMGGAEQDRGSGGVGVGPMAGIGIAGSGGGAMNPPMAGIRPNSTAATSQGFAPQRGGGGGGGGGGRVLGMGQDLTSPESQGGSGIEL